MNKQCPSCLKILSLGSFNKDAGTKDGYRARCRDCDKNRIPYLIKQKSGPAPSPIPVNTRRAKACKKYEKTFNGLLMRTYRNMKSRVLGIQKPKAHLYKGLSLLPKEEFYEFSKNNKHYQKLYENWLVSNYSRDLTPSIDRIDASKGYELSNIRWITHSENSHLGAISRWKK